MRVLWLPRMAIKRLIVLVGLGARLIEFCDRCGRRSPIVWHAPDALWFRVTGSKNDVFCPSCFRQAAEKLGIYLRWVVESKP